MMEDNKTINVPEAIAAQDKYCKEHKVPHFAPHDGFCFRCGNQIYNSISVEEAGETLVTGCPICCISYCE